MDYEAKTKEILDIVLPGEFQEPGADITKLVRLLTKYGKYSDFAYQLRLLFEDVEGEENPLEMPEEYEKIYESIAGVVSSPR